MSLKLGMNILSSSYYIHSLQIASPPISSMGEASARVDRVRKSLFYALLWWLTTRDRRLAQASNVGLVK